MVRVHLCPPFPFLLLKKEKETKEKRDCLKDMHFKSVYQEISKRNLIYLLISVLEREQRTKKQLENRIERKQDENEETTSK